MGKVIIIIMGLLLLTVWLGFWVPQYAAWKNKCYRSIAIFISAFVIGNTALISMLVYGDFIEPLWYETNNLEPSQANELILCLLGFVGVFANFFCWWYIYGRKSMDYVYIDGYTAEELRKLLSSDFKKLIGWR